MSFWLGFLTAVSICAGVWWLSRAWHPWDEPEDGKKSLADKHRNPPRTMGRGGQ